MPLTLKDLPLHQSHIALKAKMICFTNFNMPLCYGKVSDEHLAVRRSVGLFDVSHMGEFIVKGSGAKAFLQFISANDINKLSVGKAQYSYLPNSNGGIIDDLIIYQMGKEEYMLVVNASNIQKDWNWLQSNSPNSLEWKNISESVGLLALQGPNAYHVLKKLTSMDIAKMPPFSFLRGNLAGIKDVIVSATGYTGERGYEIYFNNNKAQTIWDAIMNAGTSYKLLPVGLGARDSLRIEMGYCLYGQEIHEQISPLEADLNWVTKLDTNFMGSKIIREQKKEGIKKTLISFVLQQRAIPRSGYKIVNKEGSIIGEVTSGVHSPVLNQGIGMGFVEKQYAKTDTMIGIEIRNKTLMAIIKKKPLV